MKIGIKYVGLVAVGLLTALLLYPAMHEIGHVIASVICGASVLDFTLFPIPSVLCDMASLENELFFLIGISGALFPFGIAALIKSKSFWITYISNLLIGICIFSFMISMVGLLIPCDTLTNQDDFVRVADMIPCGKILLLILCIGGIAVGLFKLIKSGFIGKCKRCFGI